MFTTKKSFKFLILVILSLSLLLVSCSDDAPDPTPGTQPGGQQIHPSPPGGKPPMEVSPPSQVEIEDEETNEDEEVEEEDEDEEESSDDEIINFYVDNLADYANLEVVEKWQFESDLSTSYDGAGGNLKGAVDVQEFNGVDYMHVRGQIKGGGGEAINTWIINDDSEWEYLQISISEEGFVHSHPFGVTGPEGDFNIFFQSNVAGTDDELWISKAVSGDGINFDDPESFYILEDDEEMDPYDCSSAAHGRVAQLDDGNYLIAFSASCQRDNFDLANAFMAGMLIGYSSDLDSLDVEELSYVPACNDPTIDMSQGEVYLYCDLSGYVDGDWDDSQYTMNQGVRLIVRYDLGDGYDFDPAEPAGLVYFYDEDGDWVSVEEYKIDDIDIHQSSDDGVVRLYTTANVGDGPTIHSFTRME